MDGGGAVAVSREVCFIIRRKSASVYKQGMGWREGDYERACGPESIPSQPAGKSQENITVSSA